MCAILYFCVMPSNFACQKKVLNARAIAKMLTGGVFMFYLTSFLFLNLIQIDQVEKKSVGQTINK